MNAYSLISEFAEARIRVPKETILKLAAEFIQDEMIGKLEMMDIDKVVEKILRKEL